ncbi:MAG: hypothetical protein H6720_13090 [Sandaracinus sp.]|nr:hypothetical protein [Myxococcales bacterium]MCB9601267.1 hypothetical protein [Sandaracinus sp.]
MTRRPRARRPVPSAVARPVLEGAASCDCDRLLEELQTVATVAWRPNDRARVEASTVPGDGERKALVVLYVPEGPLDAAALLRELHRVRDRLGIPLPKEPNDGAHA